MPIKTRDKTGTSRDKTGTERDKTGMGRDKTGTVGTKQGHQGQNRDNQVQNITKINPNKLGGRQNTKNHQTRRKNTLGP